MTDFFDLSSADSISFNDVPVKSWNNDRSSQPVTAPLQIEAVDIDPLFGNPQVSTYLIDD